MLRNVALVKLIGEQANVAATADGAMEHAQGLYFDLPLLEKAAASSRFLRWLTAMRELPAAAAVEKTVDLGGKKKKIELPAGNEIYLTCRASACI